MGENKCVPLRNKALIKRFNLGVNALDEIHDGGHGEALWLFLSFSGIISLLLLESKRKGTIIYQAD